MPAIESKCRSCGTGQIRRSGSELVGPSGSVEAAARTQSAALALHRARRSLRGKQVLDVGCGGGILSEAMARAGARVLGIDLSQAVLDVAELHAHGGARFRSPTAPSRPRSWRTSSPPASIWSPAWRCSSTCRIRRRACAALAELVKPGGDVICLDVEPQAAGICGGHRRGGIHCTRAAARHARISEIHPPLGARPLGPRRGLELRDLTGIAYNPLTRSFRLSSNTDINYLAHFSRPG